MICIQINPFACSIRLSLAYANQAFDVVKMQEQTKQLEIQKQMKVHLSSRR